MLPHQLQVIASCFGHQHLSTRSTKLSPLEIGQELVAFAVRTLSWQLHRLEVKNSFERVKTCSSVEEHRVLYRDLRVLRRQSKEALRLSSHYCDEEERVDKLFACLMEALSQFQNQPREQKMTWVTDCIHRFFTFCRPLPRKRGLRWLETLLIAPQPAPRLRIRKRSSK